jgi:hypothetical protein
MARAVSRKASSWNKAVKAAFAKVPKRGKSATQRFSAAIKMAKKSYKAGSKKSVRKSSSRKSAKRCPKGMHKRMRGSGSKCVKN